MTKIMIALTANSTFQSVQVQPEKKGEKQTNNMSTSLSVGHLHGLHSGFYLKSTRFSTVMLLSSSRKMNVNTNTHAGGGGRISSP